MGFAIELYFDPQTKRNLLDLRKILTTAGVQPVLDEIGDRPHISLAVFSQVDPDELLDELKDFAGELDPMPITLSSRLIPHRRSRPCSWLPPSLRS